MATTQVTDTILGPDELPISGTMYISANSQFVGAAGQQVYRNPVVVEIGSDGVFSVELIANDTATPSGTSYNVNYSLDGPPGWQGQVPEETWVVPTSVSPVGLGSVRTSPTPSPGVSGYIQSLNGLTAVSQLFARTSDTNVTLTITSTTATHTFALAWASTLSAARGGTGGSSAASTGVPKVTSGTWSYNATAQDLTSWPAGVSNTEVGYLDGVTSAIQTQLDAKASTSSLSAYLPLAGGTVTGATTFSNGGFVAVGPSSDVTPQAVIGDAVGVSVGLGYGAIGAWIQSYGLSALTFNPQGNNLNLGAVGNYVNCPGFFRIATFTPSSASDTGASGQLAWDSSYFYICIAANTWKRVAIATW